jgi:nicotinate-nucleotide pyrophosphorylase (carboxylating)
LENIKDLGPGLDILIENALKEDVGNGDHSSNSCIALDLQGTARLFVKDKGVLAGIELARYVFKKIDPSIVFNNTLNDGDMVNKGDIAFEVKGNVRTILMLERLVLNCMQRMSGIATKTNALVKLMEGTNAKLLDTRKTTPNFRLLEKWAVRIGGGVNHRFGLYDMIMLKDNHIDAAGGITQAVNAAKNYLSENGLDIKIEVETRNLSEVSEALGCEGIDRIMLDNFDIPTLKQAVALIAGKVETEASGGINDESIRKYAETGVDFISSSVMTHSVKSLDLSLKIV